MREGAGWTARQRRRRHWRAGIRDPARRTHTKKQGQFNICLCMHAPAGDRPPLSHPRRPTQHASAPSPSTAPAASLYARGLFLDWRAWKDTSSTRNPIQSNRPIRRSSFSVGAGRRFAWLPARRRRRRLDSLLKELPPPNESAAQARFKVLICAPRTGRAQLSCSLQTLAVARHLPCATHSLPFPCARSGVRAAGEAVASLNSQLQEQIVVAQGSPQRQCPALVGGCAPPHRRRATTPRRAAKTSTLKRTRSA